MTLSTCCLKDSNWIKDTNFFKVIRFYQIVSYISFESNLNKLWPINLVIERSKCRKYMYIFLKYKETTDPNIIYNLLRLFKSHASMLLLDKLDLRTFVIFAEDKWYTNKSFLSQNCTAEAWTIAFLKIQNRDNIRWKYRNMLLQI